MASIRGLEMNKMSLSHGSCIGNLAHCFPAVSVKTRFIFLGKHLFLLPPHNQRSKPQTCQVDMNTHLKHIYAKLRFSRN